MERGMKMFLFTDDCKIGIEEIDREHEHLFEILNQGVQLLQKEFTRDMRSEIGGIIDSLKQYADVHFRHEEEYMLRIQDPEYEMQKAQHRAFSDKINALDVERLEGDPKEEFGKIVQFMTKWLYRHILSSDTMIGKMQPVKEWKENPCAFTPEYYTGIEQVDDQHKKLFEIIGTANDLINNEFIPDKFDYITDILTELTEYTKVHFADEEKYMESAGYEGLEAQRQAHAGFIEKLEDIQIDGFEENQQEVLMGMMDFLFNWLVQHILKMDKKIPVK